MTGCLAHFSAKPFNLRGSVGLLTSTVTWELFKYFFIYAFVWTISAIRVRLLMAAASINRLLQTQI